jgi:hypothetical protein
VRELLVRAQPGAHHPWRLDAKFAGDLLPVIAVEQPSVLVNLDRYLDPALDDVAAQSGVLLLGQWRQQMHPLHRGSRLGLTCEAITVWARGERSGAASPGARCCTTQQRPSSLT